MATKKAKNTTKKSTKSKTRSTPVKVAKKTERKRITKTQRNADGTFKKGNAGGGRKPECMSARSLARIMVEDNPKLLEKALGNLFDIASDKEDTQSVSAIDKVIKLLGNYDPQETKDVTPKRKESSLDDLTVEELRKLKALKEKSNDDKK